MNSITLEIEYNGRKRTNDVFGSRRLTPLLARVVLYMAFGKEATSGKVWHGDIGYRVYGNSARKIKRTASEPGIPTQS